METNAPDTKPALEPKESRLSWYSPAAWKSKASPISQIANASVSVSHGATTDSSVIESVARKYSVCQNARGDRKSYALAAEPTRIHAVATLNRTSAKDSVPLPSESETASSQLENTNDITIDQTTPPHKPCAALPAAIPDVDDVQDSISTSSTAGKPQGSRWYAWWSRPDDHMSEDGRTRRSVKTEDDDPMIVPPAVPVTQTSARATNDLDEPSPPARLPEHIDAASRRTTLQWEGIDDSRVATRSWFPSWSKSQNMQSPVKEVLLRGEAPAADAALVDNEQSDFNNRPEPQTAPQTAGWAFWSSGQTKHSVSTPGGTKRQIGELAVADSPSQSHPELAQFNEQSIVRSTSHRIKRGKLSNAQADLADASAEVNGVRASQRQDTGTRERKSVDAESSTNDHYSTLRIPRNPLNMVKPTFDSYPSAPVAGYLQRLSRYLIETLRLPSTYHARPSQHVFMSKTPIKVHKAVAIGVHGFFPSPVIQMLFGPPTGTSIRFANTAAAEIKAWCDEHQPHISGVEIEKVALEGEGLVADRVALLWKLLLNWLNHLRQADFILIACHSQGVPVACMLSAKLIQLGCLSPTVRIGICAMAGINLGPFPEYRIRFFGASALELFDFADPNSNVSKAYVDALDVCLRHAVRISYIGSLDDQLVSLESSLHMPLVHPYVNRAVFIDGRLYKINFLIRLVVFALKLRNWGYSDHGLIRELSGPLAGSLVGGEGHSRLYLDHYVYRHAIRFALESTDMLPEQRIMPPSAASSLLANDRDRALEIATARRASLSGYPSTSTAANGIRRGSLTSSTSLPGIAPMMLPRSKPQSNAAVNPFYLPWAVRGIMEEPVVKCDDALRAEATELIRAFEHWNPSSKVLKDIRWRLEGLRTMPL